MTQPSEASDRSTENKVKLVVDTALDRKAERPVALDVRPLSSFADAFVLLTGRSDRQVRAIADAITRALKNAGDRAMGVEGLDEGEWVLIDAGDVVVHVFDPEARERYDLERLWADAERIDLGLPPEVTGEADGGAAKTGESLA